MELQEYILLGGALVVLAIIGHGLLKALLARRAAGATAEPEDGNDDAPVDPADSSVRDAPLLNEPEDEITAPTPRRGRRVHIPGKRTEPTVPRRDRNPEDAGWSVPEAQAQPDAADVADADNAGEVLVIWLIGRNGAKLPLADLAKALTDSRMEYGERGIFQKIDPRSGRQQFVAANRIKPGTFDLSRMDELDTPGIALLMQLHPAEDAPDNFDAMLEVAQNAADALGAELRDEEMNAMSKQTLAHYKERIFDFRRRTQRQ